jgi:hypothetical protein
MERTPCCVSDSAFPFLVSAAASRGGSNWQELVLMFGNPKWFRSKAVGFGLAPLCVQGWLYAGGWAVAIGLPFLLLVTRHQGLEALVWLVLAFLGLTADVRKIRSATAV